MLLQPGCHAADEITKALCLVILIAIVEKHRGPNVLKSAMIRVLRHDCSFLRFKDANVSFQLLILLFKCSVGESSTT